MRPTWRSEKLVATSKRKMKYFYKRPGNRWINQTSQEWPTSIFSQQNQYIIKGKGYENWLSDRAISIWPWKMVPVSVRYLFYQPMDEKIKTWTLRFPAKENPNMEKALFDWPIVLQYDVKAKYRLISRKFSELTFFSPECSLNQPKATRVCIRSINQLNRSISSRLCFLFRSRVSFQDHTKIALTKGEILWSSTKFSQLIL